MRYMNDEGMETAVSMFLLLTAALLIASIGGSLLIVDEGTDDLFRLRSHQVRSMGKILATWEPENGTGTLLDMLVGPGTTMMFHRGSVNGTSDDRYVEDCVVQFFTCSPDGLDPFILVVQGEDVFDVEGEHAEWRYDGAASLRLLLPVERAGLEVYG